MKRLLESIINMSKKAVDTDDAETAEKLAHGVNEMASAYTMLKDIEIHERFHIESAPRLPGEGPVTPIKHN